MGHTSKQETLEEEVELQGGTLAITWEDCGDASTHAKVTDVQPTTVTIGTTETIQGTGTVDEDITAVHFVATIKAAGIKIASCEGDASADIVCNMPLNAGKITVKQLPLPIAAGPITVPAEISTASVIPAGLAKIDAELRATEQNGEDVVCMNIHTTKQEEEEVELQGGTLAITWEDCGAKHATVTYVQPTTVTIGTTETIKGTGTVDEDITAVHFVATIKAAGIKIASCEGDASADIVCKMPLNAGTITVKQLPLPIAAGAITVPAEISTASVIPASLA